MTTTHRLPTYELSLLNGCPDPYPLYSEWRAATPLVKGGLAQWGVTRHADVSRLLKDPRLSHEMPKEYTDYVLGVGATSQFRQNSILMKEGAAHLRLRRLMARAFTPRLVRDIEQRVESLVVDFVEPLRDGETANLVDLLAFPLPTAVICELMGIPAADRAAVRARTGSLLGPDKDASDAAVEWLRQFMDSVLRNHRPDEEGDLLDRMLAADDGDDRLTHEEIVDNAVLLFFGGFETTRHVIASGAVALAQRPDQWALLRATPEAVSPLAVEELFRYDSPVQTLATMVVEPIEVGDHTIKAGQVVHLLLGGANRDDDVFTRADQLDITRAPNPHVTFGGGPHRCLGMHLARLETTVVFRSLARLFATFELAGEPIRGATTFRAYEDVPVRGAEAGASH